MFQLGDIAVDGTAFCYFPTFDSDGASVTITGLAVTDIEIFVDGVPTTRASDNGYTLLDTDGIDFDGMTGIHGFSIDLSDNSDAGFYVAGSHYMVAVNAITVDSQTVSFLYVFTIGQLLRPTTAGRTADIQATGEMDANLTMMGASTQSATDLRDFADAGYDPATNKVQGVVLVDTTTAVTNTVNANAVSAIAAFFQDCFTVDSGEVSGAEVSGSLILEIAKVVWDRVLSGGTHNINTSAGKRLRQIQENLGYEGGFIWVDTVNGSAGTVNFENGTVGNPSSNMADANALAASLNLQRFHVAPGSTVTLAASQDNQQFDGCNWTLALGGQSISNTKILGADASGVATGASPPSFTNCHFGNATLPPSHLESCGLEGTITAGSAGDFFFDTCHSGIAGTSSPVFDFGSGLNASDANFRRYSGGIEIQNMGAGSGSYSMSLEGDGQLIINANCSATSTVAIRGNFTVADNASGAVTLSDEARFEVQQITGGTYSLDTDSNGRTRVVGGTGAGEINLDAGAIVLVKTTTTNTDMRGTDGANTTVPDAAGTAAGLHSTTDGLIGGLHNFNPANDTVARVTLVDTITTYTGNTKQTADVATLITTVGVAGAGLTAINLPNQTMNITGNLSGSVGSVSGSVGSVTGNVGGNVVGSVGSVVTKTGYELTAGERTNIADAVLLRDASNVEATAGDHSLCYVILAMSEANTTANAGKLTIFRTDGSTEFVQKTLATDASADPATGLG